jgi:hypothetical protein
MRPIREGGDAPHRKKWVSLIISQKVGVFHHLSLIIYR